MLYKNDPFSTCLVDIGCNYKAVSFGGSADRAKDHIVTTLTHPDFLLRFFDDHQKRLFRNFSAVLFSPRARRRGFSQKKPQEE